MIDGAFAILAPMRLTTPLATSMIGTRLSRKPADGSNGTRFVSLLILNFLFCFQQIYVSNSSTDVSLQQEPHIFLKVNKKLIKINLNDILYIESLKDYIKVITTIGDYVVHKSLTAITEELPQSNFIRIHRSYTISINKVIALEGNTVEISNRKIPIGRNYVKQTKERIFNINDNKENNS